MEYKGNLKGDALKHYGVLGMKWGVRRARRLSNRIKRMETRNSKLYAKSAKIKPLDTRKFGYNTKKADRYRLRRELLAANIAAGMRSNKTRDTAYKLAIAKEAKNKKTEVDGLKYSIEKAMKYDVDKNSRHFTSGREYRLYRQSLAEAKANNKQAKINKLKYKLERAQRKIPRSKGTIHVTKLEDLVDENMNIKQDKIDKLKNKVERTQRRKKRR